MRGVEFIITADVVRISMAYSKHKGISIDDAMRIFFDSATYRALVEPDTGLCFEMFEVVYDMFLEEVSEHELQTNS